MRIDVDHGPDLAARRLGAGLMALLLCAVPAFGFGVVPRSHHAWGRFQPGSWKLVRVSTEAFDASRNLTRTTKTETRTTLVRVDDSGVQLRVESTHEIAGKKFQAEPQIVIQRFDGEQDGQTAEVRLLGTNALTIEGHEIPCTVQQSETVSGNIRTVTRSYYSDKVAPYVLRTDIVSTAADTGAVTNETTLRVYAFDMPEKVLAQTLSTAHLEAVHRHPKGTTRTLLVSAVEVPGGVVSHASKELDSLGRLATRSTLELVDYHAVLPQAIPAQQQEGAMFRRRALNRFRFR